MSQRERGELEAGCHPHRHSPGAPGSVITSPGGGGAGRSARDSGLPRTLPWGAGLGQRGAPPAAARSLGCPAERGGGRGPAAPPRRASGRAQWRASSRVAMLRTGGDEIPQDLGSPASPEGRARKEPGQGGERSGSFWELWRQTTGRDRGDWAPPFLDGQKGRGTPALRWARTASGAPRAARNATYSGERCMVVVGGEGSSPPTLRQSPADRRRGRSARRDPLTEGTEGGSWIVLPKVGI